MYSIFIFLAEINDPEDKEKFQKLYNKYEKNAFKIAYGFLNDLHYAEEATQTAFFALSRNIDKIDMEDEEKTDIYVYKCIKSASIDILRKNSRSPELVSIDLFFNLSSYDDVDSAVEMDETVRRLTAMILRMPEIYRDVLVYHYITELSAREIADLLHIPLSTVKSRLKRGNEMLKEMLKEALHND